MSEKGGFLEKEVTRREVLKAVGTVLPVLGAAGLAVAERHFGLLEKLRAELTRRLKLFLEGRPEYWAQSITGEVRSFKLEGFAPVPVKAEPAEAAKLLGYIKPGEQVYQGVEVWGSSYASSDEKRGMLPLRENDPLGRRGRWLKVRLPLVIRNERGDLVRWEDPQGKSIEAEGFTNLISVTFLLKSSETKGK